MIVNEEIVNRHINHYRKIMKLKKYEYYSLLNLAGLTLLSPLYVISILKQLSVNAHKDMYLDPNIKPLNLDKQLTYKEKIYKIFYNKTKTEHIEASKPMNEKEGGEKLNVEKNAKEGKLSNVNKQPVQQVNKESGIDNIKAKMNKYDHPITLRDKINKNLIETSGVQDGGHPYRAPIFEKYKEMFKVLNRQGIASFYKGNVYRIIYFYLPMRLSIVTDTYLSDMENKFRINSFLKSFLMITLFEVMLHPIFLIENRYVLQNRLPHFRAYNSIFKFYNRSILDIYNGCLGHFLKNILIVGSLFLGNTIGSAYDFPFNFFYNIGLTLSYPIQTALRRLCCQSTKIPGMLPIRYLNLLHAISLIKSEEGIVKGLYKGFLPYIIAMNILIIFFVSNSGSFFENWKNNNVYLDNDAIFQSIRERKVKSLYI